MKNCHTPKNPKMCDPILVTLLKKRPHYNQYSGENATQSSSTSPSASYKEVPLGRLGPHASIADQRALIQLRAQLCAPVDLKLHEFKITNLLPASRGEHLITSLKQSSCLVSWLRSSKWKFSLWTTLVR